MKFLLATLLSLVLVTPGFCSQLNIVVVLDGSGSMGDTFSKSKDRISKMDAAKKALTLMLDQVPSNTNIGVICFSDNVNGWLYKLGPINKQKLKDAINSVNAGGGTPLGKYMKTGANALLEFRAKQKSGIYKLVVVTDGESSDDVDTPLIGKYGILSKGLKVEAIGVDMGSRHTLATKVPYQSAESAEQLTSAVKSVVAESTGTNDHSEDYDLIAPIPPEIAIVAIKALSEFDNTPVGQKPKSVARLDASSGNSGHSGVIIVVSLLAACVVIGIIVAICNRR